MDDKERMIEILMEYNIKIDIYGCGCCSSPWVTFEHKEEIIFDDEYEQS